MERGRALHPARAAWTEEGFEATRAHVAFPKAHRSKIGSAKGLAWRNRAIDLRTRIVRVVLDGEGCLGRVGASRIERNEAGRGGTPCVAADPSERHANATREMTPGMQRLEGTLGAQPTLTA